MSYFLSILAYPPIKNPNIIGICIKSSSTSTKPLLLALGRQSQADLYESESSLVYIESSKTVRDTKRDCVSKQQMKFCANRRKIEREAVTKGKEMKENRASYSALAESVNCLQVVISPPSLPCSFPFFHFPFLSTVTWRHWLSLLAIFITTFPQTKLPQVFGCLICGLMTKPQTTAMKSSGVTGF